MLDRFGPRRLGTVERAGLGLAVAGAAGHLFTLGALLVSSRVPAIADQPGDVVYVVGGVSVALLGAAWLLALWVNDADEAPGPGARRRWLVVLLVLNLYAGAVYFLTRAIRRRKTGDGREETPRASMRGPSSRPW